MLILGIVNIEANINDTQYNDTYGKQYILYYIRHGTKVVEETISDKSFEFMIVPWSSTCNYWKHTILVTGTNCLLICTELLFVA